MIFLGGFGEVFGITLYAPRLPADPLARSEFTRYFVHSLLSDKRHANAHTLGGTPPQEPPSEGWGVERVGVPWGVG